MMLTPVRLCESRNLLGTGEESRVDSLGWLRHQEECRKFAVIGDVCDKQARGHRRAEPSAVQVLATGIIVLVGEVIPPCVNF